MSFSKDQTKLAFTFTSPHENSDIWLYDMNLERSDAGDEKRSAGHRQKSYIIPKLIKYKSFDGLEIPAWF